MSAGSEKSKQITRCGHRGVSAHAGGWHVGVSVGGKVNGKGDDEFEVVMTQGSNGPSGGKTIGFISLEDGEPVFKCATDRNNIVCLAKMQSKA